MHIANNFLHFPSIVQVGGSGNGWKWEGSSCGILCKLLEVDSHGHFKVGGDS